MEPVRVASVGLGRWSAVLAEAVPRAGTLKIVACATRSPDKRADFAAKHGCRPLPSYEAVLGDPEVEAVLLTTPHAIHAEQVVAAAGAGKHVFVDKPFTLTAADATRATAACRRAGVVLAVGHQRRRQPAHRALKRLIAAGALGRVVQLEGTMSSPTGFTLGPEAWRTVVRESPAGALTSLGIHHVDTFRYLLGPVTRVMAMSRRQVLTGVEVDDSTAILLEFASGQLGYLGTSWVVANRTVTIAVHGTEAQAFCEADGERLWLLGTGETERRRMPLSPVDAVAEQLAEFGRCVREGGEPEVNGEEATADVAVLEAIVRSAETGRAVAVDERSER